MNTKDLLNARGYWDSTEQCRIAEELETAQQRIAELERELDNEQSRGIHSCGPTCSNSGCVNRRLREQVAELEAIIAEAGRQEAVGVFWYEQGVDYQEWGINPTVGVALNDGDKLYLHPDYASAARIKELEAELERERMRLAACGTAALGYFEGCCDEYKSASLDDVLRIRSENTALREKLRVAREALETCTPEGFCDYDECSAALAAIGDE